MAFSHMVCMTMDMGGSINGGFHQWMIYNGTSEKGVPPF